MSHKIIIMSKVSEQKRMKISFVQNRDETLCIRKHLSDHNNGKYYIDDSITTMHVSKQRTTCMSYKQAIIMVTTKYCNTQKQK